MNRDYAISCQICGTKFGYLINDEHPNLIQIPDERLHEIAIVCLRCVRDQDACLHGRIGWGSCFDCGKLMLEAFK